MDLRQYLKAMRKFWWVILIPAVLGAAFGAFSAARQEPVYQGSVTFFVRTTGEGTANGQFAGDQFAQRRVNSYVALLSTERLADRIIEATGLDLTTGQLRGMIGASGDVNTVLLDGTVTSASEEEARTIVEALAVEFVGLVDEVENTSNNGARVSLEVVSGPEVSQVPTRPMLTIALRTFMGLVVGFALALVFELRDTSVRTDEQLQQLGAGPLLGRVPADRRIKDAPLVINEESQSIRAEAYRQLRTNLQFIDLENPVQTLVITSSLPGEGKSNTSANLALTMAAAGHRVLVIEADFRRPRVADLFDVERAVGLSDALVGRVALDDVIQPWGSDRLEVLPSGQLPPNPSELLGSDSMARLIERCRSEFDTIIIDTPPLLPVTDAAVVASRADGTLLAIRHGRTSRHQVSMSIRSLEAVGANVLGSVFTMVPMDRASGYSSYQYEPHERSEDAGRTIRYPMRGRKPRAEGPRPDRRSA